MKCVINNVMLDIEMLACLLAQWPVGWEADPEKLFQFLWIYCVPIASIGLETNEDYIYFKRNLEWDLHPTHLHEQNIQSTNANNSTSKPSTSVKTTTISKLFQVHRPRLFIWKRFLSKLADIYFIGHEF